MLTIPSEIILSDADKKRFASADAVCPEQECYEPESEPEVWTAWDAELKCKMCNGEMRTIFQWDGLDLCSRCVSKIVKVRRYKELRAMPHPEPSYITLKQAERYAVKDIMDLGMTIKDSAAALGITRATLYAKLKEYGIERDRISA